MELHNDDQPQHQPARGASTPIDEVLGCDAQWDPGARSIARLRQLEQVECPDARAVVIEGQEIRGINRGIEAKLAANLREKIVRDWRRLIQLDDDRWDHQRDHNDEYRELIQHEADEHRHRLATFAQFHALEGPNGLRKVAILGPDADLRLLGAQVPRIWRWETLAGWDRLPRILYLTEHRRNLRQASQPRVPEYGTMTWPGPTD